MAGAAVKKATETLVKAAQQASVQVEDEAGGLGPAVSLLCMLLTKMKLMSFLFLTQVKGGVMKDWRKELETQERIVRMQRELEKAKEDLYKIRKERAKH